MKKKLSVLALVVFMAGCITIEMGGDTTTALVEVAARRLAYHSAIKYPDIIEPGLALCHSGDAAVANEFELKAFIYDVRQYVHIDFVQNDPLLMDDIETLAGLVSIDLEQPIGNLTDEQRQLIDIAIGSFRSGLLTAKEVLENERAKLE